MSDNPKDDEWGMTIPPRQTDEPKAKESIENFSPKVGSTPSAPPADEWGMTTPNVNIRPSAVPPQNQMPGQPMANFDNTTPNINFQQQFSDTPKAPSGLPADDWGITEANVNAPKDGKKEDWHMPQPVFRISEGEKPTFDKTIANFNLRNANENFDPTDEEDEIGNRTTPYYRLPDSQTESSPAAEPQSAAAGQTADNENNAKTAVKAKSGNMKWILLLGGLFGFFLIVTTTVVAVYFLYIDTSGTVKSNPDAANKPTETAPAVAPAVEPSVAPTVAATTDLPSTINYKSDMVLVAAGEFTMGSDAGSDESKPAHKVNVPAFYIDKTEVTNAQYKEFCAANSKPPPPDPFWEKGYFEKHPNSPVLGVSFDDAKAYAAWAGKRLPTEQEWEKAASWDAAKQSKLEFPWGRSFENGKAAFGLTAPKDVGSFPAGASPSGAMDMAGNVAEWVEAFFQPYPGNTTSNSNFGEINRVARGGFFGSKTNENLKSTKRIYLPASVASGEDGEKLFAAAIGFRCAVSADDSRLKELLKK